MSTPLHKRAPQRLTITMSWAAFERLTQRAQQEGRSMSNLGAWLIERSLCDGKATGTRVMD